jgi:hypothetical protein
MLKGFFVFLFSMLFLYGGPAQGSFVPFDVQFRELGFNATMNQTQFDNSIKKFESLYKPIFVKNGKSLRIKKMWSDNTVNASMGCEGNDCVMNLYGGMAKALTPEGFELVICHETGHAIGGYPFYTGDSMSNEGQSDYWATLSCARKLWQYDDSRYYSAKISAKARQYCDTIKYTASKQLCYKSMFAGYDVSRLLAKLNREPNPSFSTPDLNQVYVTEDAHPAAQCRLDTYVSGATCLANMPDNVIPQNKSVAYMYSCSVKNGMPLGQRPGCWYAD